MKNLNGKNFGSSFIDGRAHLEALAAQAITANLCASPDGRFVNSIPETYR